MDASHVADDLEAVILTEDEILARVATLAEDLHRDLPDTVPVLVGVLGGAATFTVDLARAYPAHAEIAWMAIKSYSTRNRASGSVRLLKDLDRGLEGRDVVIIEDIVDTGLTLSYLQDILRAREPHLLRTACLLSKPSRRKVDVPVDYVGFEIDDRFVVGYGLDVDERYRQLRDIRVVEGGA